MTNLKMEAAIIYESHVADALRRALIYAGDDGFVASMPQLLHARVNADYDNIIWNTWFTPNSEESVVTTKQGQQVVVVVHGGGIFATPARFLKLFHASVDRSCKIGFTGLFSAKITTHEAHSLLDGELPDGTEIPIFPFTEFKRDATDLPQRYGVVMDFEMARKCKCGYETFDDLKADPLMIARAGGSEAAAVYLDKARDRHNTAIMGHWHPFNNIDPDQPQTRIQFLAGNRGGEGSEDDDSHLYGYDSESGMGGDSAIHSTSMINIARYVAVAPRNISTDVRNLAFETE